LLDTAWSRKKRGSEKEVSNFLKRGKRGGSGEDICVGGGKSGARKRDPVLAARGGGGGARKVAFHTARLGKGGGTSVKAFQLTVLVGREKKKAIRSGKVDANRIKARRTSAPDYTTESLSEGISVHRKKTESFRERRGGRTMRSGQKQGREEKLLAGHAESTLAIAREGEREMGGL